MGNRTSETRDGVPSTYSYDDNNKLTSLTGGGKGAGFGYDNNGSMTSVSGDMFGSWTLTYDDASRPTSIVYPAGADTYVYNALGQRTRANLSGAIFRYVYNGERVLEQTDDAGNVLSRYATAGASYYEPLLEFEFPDGSQRYPLYDLTGTARRLADAAGTVTDGYSFDAFGRWLSGWASYGGVTRPCHYATPPLRLGSRYGLRCRRPAAPFYDCLGGNDSYGIYPWRMRVAWEATMRRAWALGALGALACLVAGCGISRDLRSAEVVADEYLMAVRDQDVDKAMSMFDSRGFQQGMTEKEWRKVLAGLPKKLGKVKDRRRVRRKVAKARISGMTGTFVEFRYEVTYAKYPAQETVTLFRPIHGDHFVVVGHHINCKGLLLA